MLESAYANASYCLVQGRGRLGQASSEGSSIGLEMFLPFVFFHPLVIFASTSPFFFLVNLISSRWDLVVGNGDCFVTGPIELGNLLGYISVFVMYDSWETLKCAENSFFFFDPFFFLSLQNSVCFGDHVQFQSLAPCILSLFVTCYVNHDANVFSLLLGRNQDADVWFRKT
jgi:hypothetical protein